MSAHHTTSHPHAGQTVTITVDGSQHPLQLEDWADRVFGNSWMVMDGNPACMAYAIRAAFTGLPKDDEVVYGKVGGLGHLVHVDEITGGAA